jgi:N-dimethylarginine dimethylaminohydrolase
MQEAQPRYGVRSMSATLRRVLLRRPAITGDFSAADWRQPDPDLLLRQHEQLGQLLTDLGCEVEVAGAVEDLVDAVYIRDPGLVTSRGGVLFQMAKPIRKPEPAHLGDALAACGVPVVGQLTGTARTDGGDHIWLDEQTLLSGRSYRTNAEALQQLADILAVEGASLESVDLPHDKGPDHVLHLMSFISPLDDDLALVYPPLAPVRLMQALAERGITVAEVPDDEYPSMACNVLAVAPRVVVMLDGNPATRKSLERHGCQVHVYYGSEVSLKGDGGPTCLTAPLWRA